MANYNLDELKTFSDSEIKQGDVYGGIHARTEEPRWTASLDKKYGTNLMSQDGIHLVSASSVLRNIGSQYAESATSNAGVAQRNKSYVGESARGLLAQANLAKQATSQQPETDTPRAQLRQPRAKAGRSRYSRHNLSRQ